MDAIFATIIATGGLEAICGAGRILDQSHCDALSYADSCCLLAGSLDAPESFPAGSTVAGDYQTFARREVTL